MIDRLSLTRPGRKQRKQLRRLICQSRETFLPGNGEAQEYKSDRRFFQKAAATKNGEPNEEREVDRGGEVREGRVETGH